VKAKKQSKGKPSFSNLPRLALLQVVGVMDSGLSKYPRFNYSNQIELTKLTDAIERHNSKILTFHDKNDIDPSGFHHFAHIAANALMALDNLLVGKLVDDRNKAYKLKK
jgi:hypothetical protein